LVDRLSNKSLTQNIIKILEMEVEMFPLDRETDERINVKRLIFPFRNVPRKPLKQNLNKETGRGASDYPFGS
jgi:hypothetical protein